MIQFHFSYTVNSRTGIFIGDLMDITMFNKWNVLEFAVFQIILQYKDLYTFCCLLAMLIAVTLDYVCILMNQEKYAENCVLH